MILAAIYLAQAITGAGGAGTGTMRAQIPSGANTASTYPPPKAPVSAQFALQAIQDAVSRSCKGSWCGPNDDSRTDLERAEDICVDHRLTEHSYQRGWDICRKIEDMGNRALQDKIAKQKADIAAQEAQYLDFVRKVAGGKQ